MTSLRHWLGTRPVVVRLMLGVVVAMTVVLVAGGALVYLRVQFALDRQLDQELASYRGQVVAAVRQGRSPPPGSTSETFAVLTPDGAVREAEDGAAARLVPRAEVLATRPDGARTVETGAFLPPPEQAYRVALDGVRAPSGPLVVATAVSREYHDEALRELLLQLVLVDLLTLAAASAVGYAVVRGALGPVERYRAAAAAQTHGPGEALGRLPVDTDRDDELTRLGHTLNALLDRVEAASTRERQLLADASHELRSPLSVMRTELEWVTSAPRGDAQVGEALTSIRSQVERMVSLSDALLDLEELRAGTDLRRVPVDVAALLLDVAARHGRTAAASGRSVVVEPEQALDEDPWVDPRWLDLAVDNLVTNALRHGAGTVRLRARLADAVLSVEVGDDGPGFPPDFAPVAFDRFTRAEASRSTPGTGLGLSLVLAVAEAHGGGVDLDGTPSRVTLRLPTS